MQQEAKYVHPYLGVTAVRGCQRRPPSSEQWSNPTLLRTQSTSSLCLAGLAVAERRKDHELKRSVSETGLPDRAGAPRPFALHTSSQLFGPIVQEPSSSVLPRLCSTANIGRILR